MCIINFYLLTYLHLYTLSRKKDHNVFVISSIKVEKFWWNLVCSFLDKFSTKSCKRFPPHLDIVAKLFCETWNAYRAMTLRLQLCSTMVILFFRSRNSRYHWCASYRLCVLQFLANVNSSSGSLYVVVRPSVVCRLSSVTFVRPTQTIEIFRNVSTPSR